MFFYGRAIFPWYIATVSDKASRIFGAAACFVFFTFNTNKMDINNIMESVSPNIFVKDIEATLSFYERLGFVLVASVPEEGDRVWAMMKNGSVTFMFQTFDSLGTELPAVSRQDGGSLLLYVQVKQIREFHDRIKGEVAVLKGLEKTFYGATEFSILDNNGYVLTFAEDE